MEEFENTIKKAPAPMLVKLEEHLAGACHELLNLEMFFGLRGARELEANIRPYAIKATAEKKRRGL